MANLKSSRKDIRRTGRRTARNLGRLTELDTVLRAVRAATEAGKAHDALRRASALLDRAAAKGLLHPRTADRQKSRLTLAVARKFPPAKK